MQRTPKLGVVVPEIGDNLVWKLSIGIAIACVFVVGTIVETQKVLGSSEFKFDLPTSFTIPRNAVTEQIDAIEFLTSDGSVEFPRGSLRIRLPNDDLITVEFSAPTTVSHKVDFQLLLDLPEVNAADTDRLHVELKVKTFDFKFSEPVRVKYRDYPVADLRQLVQRQYDETIGAEDEVSGTDLTEEKLDKLTLAVTAEPLLAQCLTMLMFGSHLKSASGSAETDGKIVQHNLETFPKVIINKLQLRFKDDASLNFNKSKLQVLGDSSITIREFVWSEQELLEGKLSVVINLGNESVIVPGQQIVISKPIHGCLKAHSNISLDNGKLVVSASPDEHSNLTIENCDVQFRKDDTAADLRLASLDVNLDPLTTTWLTTDSSPTLETIGTPVFSGHIIGGEVSSRHVVAKNVNFQFANVSGRAASTEGKGFDFEMSSDKTIPVTIETLELKKGGMVLQFGKTTCRIPSGTFTGPSEIQMNLKDFFTSVDGISCDLGKTGRVVAKGLTVSGFADGNVFLARGDFPFKGNGRVEGTIDNLEYYQKKLLIFSATDFATNIEIEEVNGDLVAKGEIKTDGLGEGLLSINSKSTDVGVSLNGVEIDQQTRRVGFDGLRVQISKAFLNRLIQGELKKISKRAPSEKKPNKTTLSVNSVSGEITSMENDKFYITASAKARFLYERYVEQVHFKVRRVLGSPLKTKVPVIEKGWSDVLSLSGKATCKGTATAQLVNGATLDDLAISLKADFEELRPNLNNVPPIIDGMLGMCTTAVLRLMNVSIKPQPIFTSLSKKDREILQRIRVDKIALESDNNHFVLNISGEFADPGTK
jgi:hypothetical protein